MVILDFVEEGNMIAVRPSGTEPKVKFYMFTHVPAEQLHILDVAKAQMQERITAWQADLQALADSIS